MPDKQMFPRWLWGPLAIALMSCAPISRLEVGPETAERSFDEVDVARIRQLYHITDELGDDLWPGFDARKIPIAINNHDREEMLVGHPDPPPEFHPFADFELNGRPLMIREGVTRYGPPQGGGWAIDLGGEATVYVSVLESDEISTEMYLTLILHESFHCYQRDYRESAEELDGELPNDDAVYSALIELESRILKAALEESAAEEVRNLAATFVAVRHERRKDLPEHLILVEGEQEYAEGTATYVEMRLAQLLAERGGLPWVNEVEDPRYGGFADAGKRYRAELAGLLPAGKGPTTFFHAMYQLGMAQGLVLDRLRPAWKEEMREKGINQFAVLEREFSLDKEEEGHLLANARQRFAYDELLSEQEKRVAEFLDTVRGFVDAPGRRYRIYHAEIPGKIRWKPRGPVYMVPESLEREKEPDSRQRLVWAGGIARFEKQGLRFESGEVPVIIGDYLEWIDPDPAPDRSDLTIEAQRQEEDVYEGLKLRTDGFSLEAARARLEWSEEVVEIHPLPPDGSEPVESPE
ncbi:MAG: hypothetical protein GY856_18405 [bacterium]|nr:hypothetical protein [bacterium]